MRRWAKLLLIKMYYRLPAFFWVPSENVIHIGIPKIRFCLACPLSVLAGEHRSSRRNIVVSRRVRTEGRRRFYPAFKYEIRPHRKYVNPCQNRISNVRSEKQALSFQVFRHIRLGLCVDRYVARMDDTNPSDRNAYWWD